MKRLFFPLLLLLVVATAAASLPVARAADGETTLATPRPVAVLSCAGYNAWLGNVDVMGQVSGNPDLAKGLEAMLKLLTGSRGLVGLDKDRPAGAMLVPQGDRLIGFGYVPVTNLKELIAALTSLNPNIAEAEDGVWRLPTDQGRTFYVTQRADWAVIADRIDRLDEAPAAPATMLAKLAKQYDLALRVLVADSPQSIREKFVADVQKNIDRDLQRQSGEDAVEYAARKWVTESLAQGMVTAVDDLEQLTIGWSLDGSSRKMSLDVAVVAQPGTKMARQLARLEGATTQFAGFHLPEAAVSGHWAGKLSATEADVVSDLLDTAHARNLEKIDRKSAPAQKKADQKRLAESLLDVVRETIRGNRIDGAMTVVVGPEKATLLVAEYVANGSKLEAIVRFLADVARRDNPKANDWIHLDADKCEGVRLHTLSVPIGPEAKHRQQVVDLLGETLEVVVGVGRENVYLAAGRDAMGTLKRAIAASQKELGVAAAPTQWTVALGPLAEFAARVGKPEDRPKAAALAAILKESSDGQDHVTLTVAPIPDGVRVRLETEAGLLKSLGALSAQRGIQ